jgi:hypothetical protein
LQAQTNIADDVARNVANGIFLNWGMAIHGVREHVINKSMANILRLIRKWILIDLGIIHGL